MSLFEAYTDSGKLQFSDESLTYRVLYEGSATTDSPQSYIAPKLAVSYPEVAGTPMIVIRGPVGVGFSVTGAEAGGFSRGFALEAERVVGRNTVFEYKVICRVPDGGQSGLGFGLQTFSADGQCAFDSGFSWPIFRQGIRFISTKAGEATLNPPHSSGIFLLVNPNAIFSFGSLGGGVGGIEGGGSGGGAIYRIARAYKFLNDGVLAYGFMVDGNMYPNSIETYNTPKGITELMTVTFTVDG